MILVRMAILEDLIKHDTCKTVLKKLKSERIFKLMKSSVHHLYDYDYTGKQKENNEEESVDGEES